MGTKGTLRPESTTPSLLTRPSASKHFNADISNPCDHH